MKLDILVLAAHPDDAEISCAGTIAKHISLGYKVGVLDLTRGELGTRGTPEIRAKEAADAARILGLTLRDNAGLSDGFFKNDPEDQLVIVKAIRKYKPTIVLANAIHDRHPDHPRGAELAYSACFIAGLSKVETFVSNEKQEPWRPLHFYHFIQSLYIKPDFIVDISGFWEIKMKALLAYQSQFYNPNSNEPDTYISSPEFLKLLESRAQEFGHLIGGSHGEGFTVRRHPGVKNLFDLM